MRGYFGARAWKVSEARAGVSGKYAMGRLRMHAGGAVEDMSEPWAPFRWLCELWLPFVIMLFKGVRVYCVCAGLMLLLGISVNTFVTSSLMVLWGLKLQSSISAGTNLIAKNYILLSVHMYYYVLQKAF